MKDFKVNLLSESLFDFQKCLNWELHENERVFFSPVLVLMEVQK